MSPKSKTSKIWIKTPVANLYRHGPSARYYMRAKILGEDVKRTLKTKSFEIAKINLLAIHEKERTRVAAQKESGVGGLTIRGLIERFKVADEADRDLKPSTKSHHLDYIKTIENHWPEALTLSVARLTAVQCEEWALKLRTIKTPRGKAEDAPKLPYSAAHYNGVIDILRRVLQQAVDLGLRVDNPAAKIGRLDVKRKPIVLPSSEKFHEVLARMDSVTERKRGAIVVRFLVYGGPRISTARAVMPQDVDLERNEIVLRTNKNDAIIHLPMIPPMRKLVELLLKEHPGHGPLLPIKNPRKALKMACQEVGIPPLTNHQLRHYFTTACLESGIDIRTVAEWRGDRDNGAMLLKTYAHVRREHSQKMAKKVRL